MFSIHPKVSKDVIHTSVAGRDETRRKASQGVQLSDDAMGAWAARRRAPGRGRGRA